LHDPLRDNGAPTPQFQTCDETRASVISQRRALPKFHPLHTRFTISPSLVHARVIASASWW
jgi:hypothetical protein